jgi:glucose/arabinose dehydrogenase
VFFKKQEDPNKVVTAEWYPWQRNSHPRTGALYTVVNERDGMGDDLVPDYLTRVAANQFYGWPYAYLAPSLRDTRVPDNAALRARTRTPDVLFQSHSVCGAGPCLVLLYTGRPLPGPPEFF